MAVKRLELGTKARAGLAEIWLYTEEQWDEAQAQKYTDALNTAIDSLVEHRRGRKTKFPGYFALRVQSHIIYYREIRPTLRVHRILHISMDAARHLR